MALDNIHIETISPELLEVLDTLMSLEAFNNFRLVGGTSLSLMIGHRMSVDIDLFSDADYSTIDFKRLYTILKDHFPYVSNREWVNKTMGNSCFIGQSKDLAIKLDLFYTDPFIYPIKQHKHWRLSSLEEIAAMKLEVITRGGRKKDFWDIHALLNQFTLPQILEFYTEKYPYHPDKATLLDRLLDFNMADEEPDPICLLGKHWKLIKLDLEELIKTFQ